MDLDTKQYGELMSRIGGMESKLDHVCVVMERMNASYIGRDEYNRRHKELSDLTHQRDVEIEKKIADNRSRVNSHAKRIDALELVDAKATPRNALLDRMGSGIIGSIFTILALVIGHYLHLI